MREGPSRRCRENETDRTGNTVRQGRGIQKVTGRKVGRGERRDTGRQRPNVNANVNRVPGERHR